MEEMRRQKEAKEGERVMGMIERIREQEERMKEQEENKRKELHEKIMKEYE